MSYQTLKEQLKTGALLPAYHFYGEEQYLKTHYLGLIRKATVEEGMETFNLTVLEGNATAESIITALETPPMMAEKKLVILKDTGIFTPAGSGKAQLSAAFEDFPPYAHLICMEEKFDKRSAVFKAFSKIGLSVEFAYRSRADIKAWIVKLLKQNGKTMKPNTLELFLDAAGVDMHSVLSHLEKLIAHSAGRPEIKEADVESQLVKTVMTKEYVLTDALLAKNSAAAFSALSDLWEMQTDPIRILSVIASNFMSCMHARAMLDDKIPYPTIVDALHLPAAFLAKKTVEAANKTDTNRLERCIGAIKDADYKMKLGMVEPKTGITLLCAELLK